MERGSEDEKDSDFGPGSGEATCGGKRERNLVSGRGLGDLPGVKMEILA